MNKIDYIEGLEQKINEKKVEFVEKYDKLPMKLKIGWAIDLTGGKNIFSEDDIICELGIIRDDENPDTLEVF